jgi:hypothetical protein
MAAHDVSSGRRGADAGRVMWGVTSGERRPEVASRSRRYLACATTITCRAPEGPAVTSPALVQSLDDGLGRVFGGLLSARRALPRPHSRNAEVGTDIGCILNNTHVGRRREHHAQDSQ